MLVSRDGEYMMTGGDKGIVEVNTRPAIPTLSYMITLPGLENFQLGSALRLPCL